MNVEIREISPVKKEIRVIIPEDVVSEKFALAYKTIGKTAKIKGFRPGKAPKHMLKRSYGGSIIHELLKDLINETYYKAISDNNLFPENTPDIVPGELEEGKSFRYTATVETKPEIKDIKYKNLSLTREKLLVSEENIDRELKALRNQHSTSTLIEDPEKTVENGNIVEIDFEGYFRIFYSRL